MIKIITTSEMQKNIGQISKSIDKNSYIVTNNGKGKMVVLPYFDGCNTLIEDYIEDFEIYSNKDRLEDLYNKSIKSGNSDLII